jgi:hypothetical protein
VEHCALVLGGRANETPDALAPVAATHKRIRALAESMRSARLSGETTVDCLVRLGKAPLAAAFETPTA